MYIASVEEVELLEGDGIGKRGLEVHYYGFGNDFIETIIEGNVLIMFEPCGFPFFWEVCNKSSIEGSRVYLNCRFGFSHHCQQNCF
jgi:hypothetical protein